MYQNFPLFFLLKDKKLKPFKIGTNKSESKLTKTLIDFLDYLKNNFKHMTLFRIFHP